MVAEKVYDLLPSTWPKIIGELPSTTQDAVAIIEYDSSVGTEYFGQENCSIFNPIVKVVFRVASYEQGSEWAEIAKTLLHRYHDDTFVSILAVGSPIYLGKDEQKFHGFQVTFTTQVKE